MPETRPETVAFVDRAPFVVSVDRVIAAEPEEVFAVLADTPAWTDWFPKVHEARWTSEGPHGVGSTREVRTGPLRVRERFISWEPGASWGFTFVHTNLDVARAGVELATLTPTADGTAVTYTMAIEPRGPGGTFLRLARRSVRKGLARGLAGLDRRVTGHP